MNSLQLIFSPSISRNALMKRYKFKHYRSSSKVNKNTFWVKAYCINMEDPIEMKPKVLLRGHPKLSKKSMNTSLGSKLRGLCIGQVDLFYKIAKSQMGSKLHFFFQMGLTFYACTSLIIWSTTQNSPTHYFLHFLI